MRPSERGEKQEEEEEGCRKAGSKELSQTLPHGREPCPLLGRKMRALPGACGRKAPSSLPGGSAPPEQQQTCSPGHARTWGLHKREASPGALLQAGGRSRPLGAALGFGGTASPGDAAADLAGHCQAPQLSTSVLAGLEKAHGRPGMS